MIERHELEQRLEALNKNLEALQKQYIATEGAVAECRNWLRTLDEKEKTDAGEPGTD